jgi:hypothetical protein
MQNLCGLVVLACSLQVCLDHLGTVSGRAPDRSRDWDPISAPSDRERNCPKWFRCHSSDAPWFFHSLVRHSALRGAV